MNSSADRATLQARLRAGLRALGLTASDEAAEELIDYVELLHRWNGTYNLTAVRDIGEMIDRHIVDSLSIASFVRGRSLADVGSGGGLPGIPLAIIDPSRSCTLIESNGKKARFLREAQRELGLKNVKVEQSRVEDVTSTFDVVVARAFASIRDFVDKAGHLVAPGGEMLAMKGVADPTEIDDVPAGFEIANVAALDVPGEREKSRHLVVVRRATMAHDHAA